MAGISRSLLASMNLTEEQQKTIIDANADTLREIREERDRYKADAEKLPGVQKQLDDLKAEIPTKYVSKEDHEKTVADYQKFKDEIAAEKAQAAKISAVRAYFEGKQITGSNLEIAMRGSGEEIAAIELNDKGEIKDTKALDKLIGEGGVYAGLVTQPTTGARISTGAPLTGSTQPAQPSRAAQLYQQHYTALYGAQKGTEST